MSAPRNAEIERELNRFIVDELIEERYDGRDALEAGAVDSLGIEQLVDYIEEQFGVQIEDEDVLNGSLESLPALVALVDSKLRRSI